MICPSCPARDELARKDALIESLRGENDALRNKVAALAEMAFGGSERNGQQDGVVHGEDRPEGGEGAGGTEEVGSGGGEAHRARRGQRPGAPGHGRRRYEHLPTKEVIHELGEADRRCWRCGQPYQAIEGDEVSTEIEWRVEVYRKEHHRRRYRRCCRCDGSPAVMVAPVVPKVIPKGLLSPLAIAQVLVDKFALARPANKIIAALRLQGLELAPGSLAGMLHKVAGLLAPLQEALFAHARQASWWNCDETSWACFFDPDALPGARRRKWWLWVARGQEVTVFLLAPHRSAEVLDRLLGAKEEAVSGIVGSDMYAAYGCLDQVRFVNAWCWAHVRRHIRRAAASAGGLGAWSEGWLQAIATMYRAWHTRRRGTDDGRALKESVADMRARLDAQLSHPELLVPQARAVLQMMDSHWAGLVVFVSHPEIGPDNNAAERALRSEVLLRKSCGGSGAPWAAELAAAAFSVVATVAQWGLNPLTYLTDYLSACALAGGRAPEELSPYLPWSAPPGHLERWRSPP